MIIILALALASMTIVAKSMLGPLHRLRSGAVEVAGAQLPDAVRLINDSDGEGVPPEVKPIDVDSSDEIGDVARAFDQVHREALRMAADQAAIRGKLNAILVNLSRRSQSLVERQIRLIDDLEQGEQHADRLARLFKLDHLTIRMRRYSHNLLVLAGHELPDYSDRPVELVNVIKAAVSEIEEYERVSLRAQPGIAVRGPAVNDVVHLLAELTENAASLSPADTSIVISGRQLASGRRPGRHHRPGFRHERPGDGAGELAAGKPAGYGCRCLEEYGLVRGCSARCTARHQGPVEASRVRRSHGVGLAPRHPHHVSG